MTKLKPWLVLILVFAAGAVSGVIGTRIAVRHFIAQAVRNPDVLRDKVERDLARKLDLTTDQEAKVRLILQDAQGQIRDLRREFGPRYMVIMNQAEREIAATLTPEQRRLFDRYREENRRFLQLGGPPGGMPGGPRPQRQPPGEMVNPPRQQPDHS
ncbi:MAG: hypothetical protein JWR19_243 [Pedosphaera sp.]|nr:hypothetical protein [Pedosphaera sp.]